MSAASWDRNSEGAWRATWIDDAGCLCWRVFYGYTKREAVRLLREYRQPV